MVVVRPGDWLWLSAPASSSFNVPIGCKVESVGKSKVIVVDDEGQKHTFDMVKAASRNQFVIIRVNPVNSEKCPYSRNGPKTVSFREMKVLRIR